MANSINLAKYHIFKLEIDLWNKKVSRISQIINIKICLFFSQSLKFQLLDHNAKKKAINRNISLEYKEIEVKSEYNPVAKLKDVGKTYLIGKKMEIMNNKKKNLAMPKVSKFVRVV